MRSCQTPRTSSTDARIMFYEDPISATPGVSDPPISGRVCGGSLSQPGCCLFILILILILHVTADMGLEIPQDLCFQIVYGTSAPSDTISSVTSERTIY